MNKLTLGAGCPVYLQIFSPIYEAAWRLARPFLAKHKRLQHGFSSRLVPQNWVLPFPQGLTIWIQAASGGEAYLLVKLWKQIKEDYRGKRPLRILATSCTKQGMEVFERALRDEAHLNNSAKGAAELVTISLAYFPFDQPGLMQKAVQLASPALICLLETELWPGLLLAAREKNVPVLLLNGRITPKSLAGYKLFPASFWRALAPTRILAISQPDAARFAELFANERVEVMPNIKFDLLMQEPGQASEGLKDKLIPWEKPAARPSAMELDVELAADLSFEPSADPNFEPSFEQNFELGFNSGAKPDAGPAMLLNPTELAGQVTGQVTGQVAGQVEGQLEDQLEGQGGVLPPMPPVPSLPPVVVFGSVRRQEAEAVAQAIAKLHSLNPDCLILLAPRHLHHVHVWQRQLKQAGSRHILRSQIHAAEGEEPQVVLENFVELAAKQGNLKGQVIIWDRFGELKKLYAQAAAVFVGGSLAPLGGQNFLEVLEHGLEPCIGPHWSNFTWAGSEVLNLVKQVDGATELALALHQQLLTPKSREAVKANFMKFIRAHQGGVKVAAKAVIDYLPLAD